MSNNIIKALKNRNACLLGNHGQVATGKTLQDTFELAQEVEYLSETYYHCLVMGKPKLLTKEQMQKILVKIKTYKQ